MRRIARWMILIAAVAPLYADVVVISQTLASPADNGSALSYASWTQASTYSNVAISAMLMSRTGTGNGTFYLMSQVGAGTASTNPPQLASVAVSSSSSTFASVPLFSGLTLGPGTYYLVFNAPDLTLRWGTGTVAGTTITVAAGVTANATGNVTVINAYPPASTFATTSKFKDLFTATGILGLVSSVPALSPWGLLLTATLLLGSGLLVMRKYSHQA
jgi:hypothetical protein